MAATPVVPDLEVLEDRVGELDAGLSPSSVEQLDLMSPGPAESGCWVHAVDFHVLSPNASRAPSQRLSAIGHGPERNAAAHGIQSLSAPR